MGGGSDFVLPMLRWVRYLLVERRLLADVGRRLAIRNEAGRIRSAMKGGAKRAVIVYDNLVSPPTYGDYLYIVLLARYFQASGVYVTYYIVDSEYRKDWEALTGAEANALVREQMNLAQALLDSKAAEIQCVVWDGISAEALTQSTDTIVPFAERVGNRVSTYGEYLTLLNHLLSGAHKSVVEDVLFTYQGIKPHVKLKPLPRPYITWHCRRSEKWEPSRNVSDADALQIYAYLRRRFPGDAIMVVSDEHGCSYFRNLAQENGMDLLFSKDFSSTFLGDGALILGSEFYFQFLGGGISVFPWGSRIPYETCSPLHWRFMWSAKRAFSWQTERQLFVNSYSLQYFLRKAVAA